MRKDLSNVVDFKKFLGKTKAVHSDAGCSRTLPVASSWNGQDSNCNSNNNGGNNLVKREPLASVPCQVAEVSTSLHATTTSVKIEPAPLKSENGKSFSSKEFLSQLKILRFFTNCLIFVKMAKMTTCTR